MKKKLIIFIPSIEDGGVEKNLFVVSNYLKKNGISIEILTCNINKSRMFRKGIKFIGTKNIFWQNKSRFVKYAICLLILFFDLLGRREKPLIFAFQANIYALLVAKILNTKIITRSNSAPSGWSKNFLKNFIYKFLINLADDVMVNSLEFKKSFEQKFNIKVKCIYNPFNKIFIKQNLKNKKKPKFFKKNYLNVISVGRLTDQKDHFTLLQSMNLIEKKLAFASIGVSYSRSLKGFTI